MSRVKYICIGIILMLIFFINADAAGFTVHNQNMTGNKTDPGCVDCHNRTSEKKIFEEKNKIKEQNLGKRDNKLARSQTENLKTSIIRSGNYTVAMSVGNTPQQLGVFLRPSSDQYNGWQWWDANNGQFGTNYQKNMIVVSIFDSSTGTIKPVSGLFQNTWPQASFRNHSGTYSYKADNDPTPITTQNNYPDLFDTTMIKAIDLTGVGNATLTFWTFYAMEADWDYAYVMVDAGNGWENLPGTLTTNTNPNGNNLGNGITGTSNGIWVQETMDLTPYAGKKIGLGFRFKSDTAANYEGFYIDDIIISSGPNVISSDDAETIITPIRLIANVTYPHLDIGNMTDPMTSSATLNLFNRVQSVELTEDFLHPGTYKGYFIFNPFAFSYSGDYMVDLNADINGSQVSGSTAFSTTILGCQSCHNIKFTNTETTFVHSEGGGMESCAFICHTGSRGLYGDAYMGPPLTANPMHLHEMQYGHSGGYLSGAWYPQTAYNISAHVNLSCQQCHTSFIHDNIGTDTNKIGSYTLHGTNISYSSGVHSNLSCQYCHGNLSYPPIPADQHVLQAQLGNYTPSFTSYKGFTDTYVVSVTGTDPLNVTVTGNSNKQVVLYAIGPVDNTTSALMGGCEGNPCYLRQALTSPIVLSIPSPYIGTWLISLYNLQDGAVDYTITSNYPIEKKPIIKIPECNECHKQGGTGGADTQYEIPNWNPGFAHADVDKDGNLDVQCRLCHNPMHEITVASCKDCHSAPPAGHIIVEPQYSQYTTQECLTCHGDPHRVSGGDDCKGCHGTGYIGENPKVNSTFVNITEFNDSVHGNIVPDDQVTNDDCWQCHYNKDMNRENIRKCSYCHSIPSQWHGNANITTNLTMLSD